MSEFTAADRELAAEICSYAACNPDLAESYSAIAKHLELPYDSPGLALAYEAWGIVHFNEDREHIRQGSKVRHRPADELTNPDAEAEALIISGEVGL